VTLTLITSMAFWIGFFIKFFISELINSESMNIIKIIIAGVGVIM